MVSRRAAHMAVVLTAAGALTIACGQKGPPLAPLHLVPAAANELSVRRRHLRTHSMSLLWGMSRIAKRSFWFSQIEIIVSCTRCALSSPAGPGSRS